MSFFRTPRAGLDDVFVLFGATGARAGTIADEVVVPPSGDIAPALTVEYVDASGVLQSTLVESGVTTVSGTAPLLMHFDAGASRFPAAFAAQAVHTDTEVFAHLMGGYRLNYGEGTTGTWPYGGTSRAEDTGAPIFGHAFTVVGTHTTRLKLRDTLGNEQTVSFDVVVSAPAAPTIIEVAAGAWPSWVSGTHYALRADGNYTSFGAMNFNGLHNIIVSKTGAGADPIVGIFRPDSRNVVNLPEASISLSRGIRFLDIDVAEMQENGLQFVHCGVVRGRCRTFLSGPKEYYYDNDATTVNERNSLRQTRGLFLIDCGEMNRGPDNYVMIGIGWHRHMKGVYFHLETPGGASVAVTRLYEHESSIRNCQFGLTTQDGQVQTWMTYIGTSIGADYPTDYVPVAWTDQIGRPDGSGVYKVINRRSSIQDCYCGVPGQAWPNGPGSIGGPVNTSWLAELLTVENVVVNLTGAPAYPITENVSMSGRNLAARNFKYVGGADVAVTPTTPQDAAYDGPYFNESTNSRPVPTAFV
jgi:hypothetical protein